MEKKIQNSFALVRPPGHHAEASQAMGFCLFNNAAIAAQYLIDKCRLTRILIVDWDLHHGNGTQHSFYERSDVLYFSTHQYPHYPGTGNWDETGKNSGEGYTVNVPLSPGKTDEDYLFIFRYILIPIASAYKPQFILVSAGFDIHENDPLGGMRISNQGFAALTLELLLLAHQFCQDRILFTLEGGYDLQGLKQGVKQVLLCLGSQEKETGIKASVSPLIEKEIVPVLDIQKKYWPL